MAIAAVLIAILFFGGWHIPWAYEIFGDKPYATIFPWLLFAICFFCLILTWDTTRPRRRKFTRGNMIFAGILVFVACICLGFGINYLVEDVTNSAPWMAALAGMVVQVAVLGVKFLFFFWMFIWVRWTLPRFRYDQLMKLGWKVMIPIALVNIFITSLIILGID